MHRLVVQLTLQYVFNMFCKHVKLAEQISAWISEWIQWSRQERSASAGSKYSL